MTAQSRDVPTLDYITAHTFNESVDRVGSSIGGREKLAILSQQGLSHDAQTKLLDLIERRIKEEKDVSPDSLDDIVSARMDEAVAQLEARVDSSTNLPNKRAFNEELLARHARFRRDPANNRYAVAMIDLDNFKSINDTYGHMAGDELMEMVAQLFQKSFRAGDFIARWGGDEIALILPVPSGMTPKSLKAHIQHRLGLLNSEIDDFTATQGWQWEYYPGQPTPSHLSLGIKLVDSRVHDPAAVAKAADDMATEVKRRKKNKNKIRIGRG